MKPIIKNIRVVDEQGNEYEATYPKRAKGLVKNGRARFINDNVICLACPPNDNKILEDYIMNDNTNINDIINDTLGNLDINEEEKEKLRPILEKMAEKNIPDSDDNLFQKPFKFEQPDFKFEQKELHKKSLGPIKAAAFNGPAKAQAENTYEYALQQLENIARDMSHIHEAIHKISDMPVNESPEGGRGDAAKANAIIKIVEERENTNRELIEFYKNMCDELNPNKSHNPKIGELMMQVVVKKLESFDLYEMNLDEMRENLEKIKEMTEMAKEIK